MIHGNRVERRPEEMRQVAEYTRDLLKELAVMVPRHEGSVLRYLLGMAVREAELLATAPRAAAPDGKP